MSDSIEIDLMESYNSAKFTSSGDGILKRSHGLSRFDILDDKEFVDLLKKGKPLKLCTHPNDKVVLQVMRVLDAFLVEFIHYGDILHAINPGKFMAEVEKQVMEDMENSYQSYFDKCDDMLREALLDKTIKSSDGIFPVVKKAIDSDIQELQEWADGIIKLLIGGSTRPIPINRFGYLGQRLREKFVELSKECQINKFSFFDEKEHEAVLHGYSPRPSKLHKPHLLVYMTVELKNKDKL